MGRVYEPASMGRWAAGVILLTAVTVSADPVQEAYNHLPAREGQVGGDYLTGIRTWRYGVTQAAIDAVGGTSPEDTALKYLKLLHSRWMKVPGYSTAPEAVQVALLDTTYNIGESVLKYKGVRAGLVTGDYEKVAQNLLDTANSGGKSAKGLAIRRAIAYNIIMGSVITQVELQTNGTVTYYAEDTAIFQYRPKSGKRHPKSNAGSTTVK